MKAILSILAVVLLSGCTMAQEAAIGAAVEQRRAFEDRKARLALVAPCSMSLGAYFRLTPMAKRAAEALCGGEGMPRKGDRLLGQ